jgi:hypothetical protein
MEIAVSTTVRANSEKEARLIALGSLNKDQSEFDRRVIRVEDITPVIRKARKGRGSY